MNSFKPQLCKQVLAAIVVLVGLSACSESTEQPGAADAAPATVEQPVPQIATSDIIAQAQAALAESTVLSHAWSVTQPLIDEAQSALQAGEDERARELAERALATAEASVEQAKAELTSWQSRVPQ